MFHLRPFGASNVLYIVCEYLISSVIVYLLSSFLVWHVWSYRVLYLGMPMETYIAYIQAIITRQVNQWITDHTWCTMMMSFHWLIFRSSLARHHKAKPNLDVGRNQSRCRNMHSRGTWNQYGSTKGTRSTSGCTPSTITNNQTIAIFMALAAQRRKNKNKKHVYFARSEETNNTNTGQFKQNRNNRKGWKHSTNQSSKIQQTRDQTSNIEGQNTTNVRARENNQLSRTK